MVGYHLGWLMVYCSASIIFKITLYESRQFIITLLLALKHHTRGCCLGQYFLSPVNTAVFMTQNQNCWFHRFFNILFQLFPVFYVLSLFHYHNLPLGHHRETPCHVNNLTWRNVRAKDNRLIEVAFFRSKSIRRDKICYLINIIRLLAHKNIYGRIITCTQVAHYALKSNDLFLCHIFMLYLKDIAAKKGRWRSPFKIIMANFAKITESAAWDINYLSAAINSYALTHGNLKPFRMQI